MRIGSAQLRYYFHIQNPDDLDDETWSLRLKELQYLRQKEAESNQT